MARIWSDMDGYMGIDLDKVQGFVVLDDDVMRVYMGAGEDPYTIEDKDDQETFREMYFAGRRKFWINDNDTCTMDLSIIKFILFTGDKAKVYDGTDAPIQMTIKEGRDLRNAWIEYLAW
jgi:hypothetical protein